MHTVIFTMRALTAAIVWLWEKTTWPWSAVWWW